MTVKDFVSSIVLHDSLLEAIDVCKENNTITITVDFCFWQQKDFREGTSETGIVKLIFRGVESYSLDADELNSDEIVGCTYKDENTITIQAINDLSGDCRNYTIKAVDVLLVEESV